MRIRRRGWRWWRRRWPRVRGRRGCRIRWGCRRGRGGVGPSLGLVYDSAGAGAASGWLGAGWSLTGAGEVSVDTGFGVPLFCPRASGPVCGDLKTVTTPLGGSFALDYARAGNTTDHPGSVWTMTKLTVDDGYAADGPAQTSTVRLRPAALRLRAPHQPRLRHRHHPRARPSTARAAGAGHPGVLHQQQPLQRRPAGRHPGHRPHHRRWSRRTGHRCWRPPTTPGGSSTAPRPPRPWAPPGSPRWTPRSCWPPGARPLLASTSTRRITRRRRRAGCRSALTRFGYDRAGNPVPHRGPRRPRHQRR